MLGNVSFGTGAKDAALDKDELSERNESERHMDEDVGRA